MSQTVIVPSSVEDRAKIKAALNEISASMTRIAAEKDYINDSLAALQDQFELPKKAMRKVAVVYHKQNLNEVKSEFYDIEELYVAVTA